MNFHINVACFIISILFQSYVNSNAENNLKSATIESIVQKICNITLKSLSNKTQEEQSLVLGNIEYKLKRSAIGAGTEGRKYVKFLMHGIKLVASNISIQMNSKKLSPDNITHLRTNESWTTESVIDEINAKKQAINNIAAKIEKLAQKYLKDANTPESKQAVVDTIRRKVMDAANKRHMMIHNKHKEIKSYSNIIAEGIDLMIKKNEAKNTRRIGYEDDDKKYNKGVRLKIMHAPLSSTIPQQILKKPTQFDCEEFVDEMCESTKLLQTFSCPYESNTLPLEKLCNGIFDCYDKTDERDCAEQAIDKIQNAGRIMSQVEAAISRQCISPSLNKQILSEQNQVLRTVLKSQLHFIEKYANPPIAELINPRRNELNKNIIKKTVNEVALVVTSLANALDGSLCARRFGYDNIEEAALKYSGDVSADEAFDQVSGSVSGTMRSCVCNGMACANDTCIDLCEQVCWQRFSLGRWPCRSVDDSPSISLDSICDGKLDCYDETDETGCSLGSYSKFEAGNMYNNVLKLISAKTRIQEYHFVLPDLLILYNEVKLIQKLSVQREVEIINIKIAREKCFSTINLIYGAFLNLNDVEKLNNGYEFLSSVSENLINAMKRSRTGNDRIISSDRCLCTGSRCAMIRCSKRCTRACSVEPQLTRYHCGNSKLNEIVPINAVCNGKSNCPNEVDEENCSKEVCRTHHLVLLRHKLKDIGMQQKGTALGEILTAWKTKVTSTIQIAEKESRPTPTILKDIISNILRDLVMSYASQEYTRRNNTVKEFVKISQLVIESVKSCGQ
ncbi:hypothetical protein O3G_MSEX003701 [Manduca sexta]|uniref:Uncharacterized protein n=3 Tax=Manduca sexta TaxID=7130 RepID=A0A922CFF2_MANSE|nr:hypothetical protein O3G_MSEX003701 [Manduca sexta]